MKKEELIKKLQESKFEDVFIYAVKDDADFCFEIEMSWDVIYRNEMNPIPAITLTTGRIVE